MFYHAYDSYMKYAFPAGIVTSPISFTVLTFPDVDELKPLSCSGFVLSLAFRAL